MILYDENSELLGEAWEEFLKKVKKAGYYIEPRTEITFRSLNNRRNNIISPVLKIESPSIYEMLERNMISEGNLSPNEMKNYNRKLQKT